MLLEFFIFKDKIETKRSDFTQKNNAEIRIKRNV